jgi:hypothetical protein
MRQWSAVLLQMLVTICIGTTPPRAQRAPA